MMELINETAEHYAEKMTSSDDVLLKKIHAETLANHARAGMMSSYVQGRFLSFISKMIRPEYILEIGTFTGFSGICLTEGLQPNGELHTLELREEDAKTALTNFTSAKKKNQIHLHVGDARETIAQLNFRWDLVFIDADKTGYIDYYEMVLPRMKDNGFILADNVLFHGEVLEENISGKNAKAIDAFNKHVAADERTEQVLLTIRDGLLLIKKKA
jgi:predicted O-methyltransferase YrrM